MNAPGKTQSTAGLMMPGYLESLTAELHVREFISYAGRDIRRSCTEKCSIGDTDNSKKYISLIVEGQGMGQITKG